MPFSRPSRPYHKLVSVRHVSDIKTLGSSQTHEVVMVDGWPVVVGKGQFAMKQKVLYFAIDCFLPFSDKRYEPYRFSHFLVELQGRKGWAVQTVKHEGHISQGMVFAIDDSFPEISRIRKVIEREAGASVVETRLMKRDLKESFSVRKWRTFYPPDGGISLGRPPSFLPSQDSMRVQDAPKLLLFFRDTEFEITEILDGSPMTFYDVTCHEHLEKKMRFELPGVIMDDEAENGVRHRREYGVSLGDHDYEETETSIGWKALREQGTLDEFREQTSGIGLAGVLCGPGISGNPYKIEGHRFYTYAVCGDAFDKWEPAEHGGWANMLKSAERVPRFSARVRLSAFAKDLDELMKKAQGASCLSDETREKYPSLRRKGLAFRTLDGSLNFKVIANDWLLDQTEKLRKASEDTIVSRPGPNECV